MACKLQATSVPEVCSRPSDPGYLGTPRSVRFENLFAGAPKTPTLLELTRNIHDVIESAIKLSQKGTDKISNGSESVADIKTLAGRSLRLKELQKDIPTLWHNPFIREEEDHQVECALVGAETFGCKVPEVIKEKLTKLAKNPATIKYAGTVPSTAWNFIAPKSIPRTPTYALAACKHVVKTKTTNNPTQSVFLPLLHKKPPPIQSHKQKATRRGKN